VSGARLIGEPTAWLRGTAARRRRSIEARHPDVVAATAVVVAPLVVRPAHIDAKTWDRSCDRCHVFIPIGDLLFSFSYFAGPIYFSGGLCGICARKEDPDATEAEIGDAP
jgi:hypothetical protein